MLARVLNASQSGGREGAARAAQDRAMERHKSVPREAFRKAIAG
jgi:hypothetical protein